MTPWKQRRLTPPQENALLTGRTPRQSVADALREREFSRASVQVWNAAKRQHEHVLDLTPLGHQVATWLRRMQRLEEKARRAA